MHATSVNADSMHAASDRHEIAAIRQSLLRLKSIIAAERFSRALYRHYLTLKAGYREDQLRDRRGRWADEGRGNQPRVRLATRDESPLGPRSLAKIAAELAQRVIDAYRTEQNLWDLFRRRVGTVTTTEVDGLRYFGSNSTAPSFTSTDYRQAEELRKVLIDKYPSIMSTGNLGWRPNDAVFHAEANILMRIARDHGGSLTGREIEIHGDRDLCPSCGIVLPLIGMELGNPTVRLVGPGGNGRTMRNGAWVD